MPSLDELLNHMEIFQGARLPPVETWRPPLSGEMDICIKANGDWYHEGSLIKRPALVKLFSSLLKKENQEYFLVTPVEKWKIHVEDVPLLIIASNIERLSGQLCISVKTRTDDEAIISAANPLLLRSMVCIEQGKRPYVKIRGNLEALVQRSVFYQWVNMATLKDGVYGLWSAGEFFPLE